MTISMQLHGNRGARRRFARRACAIALLLACACASTNGTTLLRMSLARMAQTAPVIVRARCLTNTSAWDAGEIWTFTTFQVSEVWRGFSGQPSPAQITVRLLGGTVGNLTSRVAGIPRFRAGEDVVLFLEPTPRGDYSVVSWQQGTFRIARDARTGEENITQDSASFATFDPATRSFAATGIRNRPLSAFRTTVEAALSGQQPTQRENP